jgi:signal peptidase II
LKRIIKSYAFLVLVAGVIILLDQLTKSWVQANIPLGQMWMPLEWLAPYARLVHISNTGAAFGLFQGASMIFTVLAFLVSIAILYYFPQVPEKDWPLRLAMGLQLGGAVGNLIDRVTIGHVTDFISVGTFAVFNIADASITVGVGVLLLGIWLQDRKERQTAEEERDPVDSDANQDGEPVGCE